MEISWYTFERDCWTQNCCESISKLLWWSSLVVACCRFVGSPAELLRNLPTSSHNALALLTALGLHHSNISDHKIKCLWKNQQEFMAMATHNRFVAFKSIVMRDFYSATQKNNWYCKVVQVQIYSFKKCVLVGLKVMQGATSSHQVLRHQREGVGGNMT